MPSNIYKNEIIKFEEGRKIARTDFAVPAEHVSVLLVRLDNRGISP
jgi:hypothetical protein